VTGTYASVRNTISIFAENKKPLLVAYIFSETVITCTDVFELEGYLWHLFASVQLRTDRPDDCKCTAETWSVWCRCLNSR
jgi:hypothetical protein